MRSNLCSSKTERSKLFTKLGGRIFNLNHGRMTFDKEK
uniref:Uncharacterized protein n=1 Tax=Rhizophora mucronata TaxID=61149 RepID=A0A2P2R2N8_RHIMU